jgi:putative addiction module component (TIGR02574 family)
MISILVDQLRDLPREEQLVAIWDGIGNRNAVPSPAEAKKAELDRRLADHAANPEEVAPWDEVVAAGLVEAWVGSIGNLNCVGLDNRLDPFGSMGRAALAKAAV